MGKSIFVATDRMLEDTNKSIGNLCLQMDQANGEFYGMYTGLPYFYYYESSDSFDDEERLYEVLKSHCVRSKQTEIWSVSDPCEDSMGALEIMNASPTEFSMKHLKCLIHSGAYNHPIKLSIRRL